MIYYLTVLLLLAISIECEDHNTMRIIGGTKMRIQDFPYIVVLRRLITNGVCGAGIISNRWLLTAAHCMYYSVSSNGSEREELLGPDSLEVWAGIDNFNGTESAQRPKIDKVIPHPNYSFNAEELLIYDIGLIKLAQPLNYTDKVHKLRLPKKGEENLYAGLIRKARVAGFGANNDSSRFVRAGQLLGLDDTIWHDEQCSKHTRPVAQKICIGDLSGKRAACHGDSGSPLVVQTKTDAVILGVVSHGVDPRSCTPKKPEVFSRVSAFLEWIKETILEN